MVGDPPVLVIGGGLAGAACACTLARAGRAVTLLDRSTGPHDKICGEFLSIEAQHDLAGMGIDLPALGAIPIDRLRLVGGSRMAEAALPFTGLSLARRVLDEALLAHAASLGVEIRRGVAVRSLATTDGTAHPLDGAPDPGRPIVLATGKHDLRGARRAAAASALVGLKMYFSRPPGSAPDRTVAIHLFPGGYAGLQPVDGGRLNLTLLIHRQRLAALDAGWDALLTWLCRVDGDLAQRLSGCVPLLSRPLSIAGVPYGFVHAARPDEAANLYRVGDQLAVIPSFSGDGMAIALRTGIQAAQAICRDEPAVAYHRRMARRLAPQVRRAQLMTLAGDSALGRRLLVGLAQLAPPLIGVAVRGTRLAA